MRLVLVPLRTGSMMVCGLVATLICGPTVVVIAKFRPTSPWLDRVARIWSKVWLVSAGCRFEVRGREHVDTTRSHVVVANHESNLDIMASFLAVPLPIRFLAKTELFKVPVLSSAMRAIGVVEVDRDARSAVHEKVNAQARDLVASGRSLIVYPEGTRSRSGELRAFKKGAFTMAVAGQIPILPVTIHGTHRAWSPDRPWVYGGKITVIIDPAIPTEGLARDSVPRLSAQAREIIARRLAELSG
jgi:1-acyl-sn-glycerol-3-phosphate acyltransferase